MVMRKLSSLYPVVLAILSTFGCATSPTGRKQLVIVPNAQMEAMGAQAFQEMKNTTPAEADPKVNAYVRCVANPIITAAQSRISEPKWEVVVFKDDTANAFALPGGKIGVHTGILKVATTDAQLAAVLGHEVGHVIARHGAERVSSQVATQLGLGVVDAFILGKQMDPNTKGLIMGALGVGSTLAYTLPHSRTQESEADIIGLDLMSRAGFDPRQSVELWKNMSAAAGGGGPPQFLSTHPASQSRIDNLQSHMGEAIQKHDRAQEAGLKPSCI